MPLLKISHPAKLAIAAATLVALGAAGGAGAMSLTRPSAEMAPVVQTPIAKLPATSGIVTVRGQVAEVYGDRVVLQDASGRAMVDAGREARGMIRKGTTMTVQGRFDDGQMRASYLVDPAGTVTPVGPPLRGPGDRGPGGPGPHGERPHGGPGLPGERGDMPPPPPGSGPAGLAPPPPPPGCAPVAGAPMPNMAPSAAVQQPVPPAR